MSLLWLKVMLNSAVRPASRQVDKAGNDTDPLPGSLSSQHEPVMQHSHCRSDKPYGPHTRIHAEFIPFSCTLNVLAAYLHLSHKTNVKYILFVCVLH